MLLQSNLAQALVFSSHGRGRSLLVIQSLPHSHTKPKLNVITLRHWKVWPCGTAGQLSATPSPKSTLTPQPSRLPRYDINIPNPKSWSFLRGWKFRCPKNSGPLLDYKIHASSWSSLDKHPQMILSGQKTQYQSSKYSFTKSTFTRRNRLFLTPRSPVLLSSLHLEYKYFFISKKTRLF